MTAPTYKTLESLIAAAERIIDDVDTVSLDVFDTVFIRRIANPDLIKIPVARFVAEKANSLGIETNRLEVARLRNQIEARHREENGAEHPDHEACYDHFMPEMLDRVFGDKLPDGFFDQVADYEIKLENAVLVPRARLVEWIESLSARGKRLLLVSDIYLPAKYIERMLADKGLDHHFYAVVSSADSFRAKASGTAYKLIEERFGLDRDKWLHVGDNPISDGVRPIEFGIRALVIDDPVERHRKNVAGKYHEYSTQTIFWRGRNLQQLMLPLEAENVERDDLYVHGYNQFGFLFGYFMQRLAERCAELKIKRLYFCSREGWLMQQCWERFAPWYFPAGDMPESRYLYVSRIALAKAMTGNVGIPARELEVALLPRHNNTFDDVCRVFGLDPHAFQPFLDKHDLSLDDNISQHGVKVNPENRRKLNRLLLDTEFQAFVRKYGMPYRDAFIRYLESEGFFEHSEIGLVDIGWLGTIHNNLFRAVSHLDAVPRIHGFLMAATRHIDYPSTPDRYFEGLLYDRHKFDIATSVIQYIKEIMEETCRAPHTSLVAYQPDGDSNRGFRLEFKPDNDESATAEMNQSEFFQPLQKGILDAVQAYSVARTVLGYGTSEIKSWLDLSMYKHIAFPRTNDVLRMRLKAHQDDFAKRDTRKGRDKVTDKGLWQRSAAALRFIPGLRKRELKKHCFRMLKI